tara:strand:- start:373 stop:894 length:522 start_codon:yes stop_codon:yes gene_type:complete
MAVRGPKTRAKLLEQGVDCPEIYGDPALLMPRYYQPKKGKRYPCGVLAHYVDKNHEWLDSLPHEVLIIDVQSSSPLDVIDAVCSCDCILSTSLHGLIISDAYRIPSLWIRLSNKIIGRDFKFNDYFNSLGYPDRQAIKILKEVNLNELMTSADLRNLNLDLDQLAASFPKEFI